MKRVFSWLREVGIVLLCIALSMPWFTKQEFNHTLIGLDFITHDFLSFLCYFLALTAYLSYWFNRSSIWIWATLFSVIAPIFHLYVWYQMPTNSDRTSLAIQLGVGGSAADLGFIQPQGFLVSVVGMTALAIGLFASMNPHNQRRYLGALPGAILGLIVGWVIWFLLVVILNFLPYIRESLFRTFFPSFIFFIIFFFCYSLLFCLTGAWIGLRGILKLTGNPHGRQ